MAPVRRGETQRPRPPWSMVEEVKMEKAGEVRSTTLVITSKWRNFFHRFASRGYASISWAFSFMHSRIQSTQKS